jgi:hypothetical protein
MEQELDGGGLACPVGAEKAENLSLGYGKGKIVKGGITFAASTKALAESVDFDGWSGHKKSLRALVPYRSFSCFLVRK